MESKNIFVVLLAFSVSHAFGRIPLYQDVHQNPVYDVDPQSLDVLLDDSKALDLVGQTINKNIDNYSLISAPSVDMLIKRQVEQQVNMQQLMMLQNMQQAMQQANITNMKMAQYIEKMIAPKKKPQKKTLSWSQALVNGSYNTAYNIGASTLNLFKWGAEMVLPPAIVLGVLYVFWRSEIYPLLVGKLEQAPAAVIDEGINIAGNAIKGVGRTLKDNWIEFLCWLRGGCTIPNR